MNDYTTVVFSDVFDRDGLGIELVDPTGRVIAEVFRDDGNKFEMSVNIPHPGTIPLNIMRWFLEQAELQLKY